MANAIGIFVFKNYWNNYLSTKLNLMKYYFLLYLLVNFQMISAQELTGQQLLNKAIKQHDPKGNWKSFNAVFEVTMSTPDQPERISQIKIDLPKEYFSVNAIRDSVSTNYIVANGKASASKYDLRNPDEVIVTTEKDAQRAIFMKNYYTYLYGLPMKLKDEGTIISDQVERKIFKGKEYLVLKVTYDQSIGSDAWFFYFDPSTYKMEVYQFFKTDNAGKVKPETGEYILLSGNHVISDINMPKTRKWYYNKNDQFLGADVITN